MKQELWLSRDKGRSGSYNIHEGEPVLGRNHYIYSGEVDHFCAEIFHRLVEGARLRKGRKRKIKRILIELED